MPLGHATRGTTGTNRLRRVDRWIAAQPALRTRAAPLVVDLGFGSSGTTVFELHERLAPVRPRLRVLGLEIDPERVRAARRQLAGRDAGLRSALAFERGGFDLGVPARDGSSGPPLAAEEAPVIVRAFNVLRQYEQDEVAAAWRTMRERLAPGGLLVEGTCDELGRVCTWFGLPAPLPGAEPLTGASFTISLRLSGLDTPLVAAERLPKALIHRNVPGEPVHALLRALDEAWRREAPRAPFGPRQRFIAAAARLREAGWPLRDGPRRWRLGELTLEAAGLAV